ncbi:antibiotic biosynthesis monooxygenase [Lewinella sp. 4G2]|uniref:antibiotic biosynthesis monooxygenase family protein n=1 Tax=Lewinella sp. 4G2 TaxID=1803372 RepID=UPI0007B47673|nr:antibiotic biosynthesis monooxygenase family protein [Lewinella sp. 4G2]OAV43013.1 hypothetical protein A3850_000185 [Lewinella sp. 4G2]
MILEHVLIEIDPARVPAYLAAFKRALPQVLCQDGCHGARLLPKVGAEGEFVLLIEWTSLAHHTEGFRNSDEYKTWSALLHPFYDTFPTVDYYEL